MKKLVIKVGGALLADKAKFAALCQSLCALQLEHHIALVHGGGDVAQDWLQQLGKQSEKCDGVRVTPADHLPFVVGALAGAVNTEICASLLHNKVQPVGLTLLDGGICKAHPLDAKFGNVASVTANSDILLLTLFEAGFIPVISSIAAKDGELLNVNADDAAVAIAQLLSAELLLLTDVPGVLDAQKQLIPELTSDDINQLIESQVINGGMVVKVKSALKAACASGQVVRIASWKTPEALASLAGAQIGTKVLPDLPNLNDFENFEQEQ